MLGVRLFAAWLLAACLLPGLARAQAAAAGFPEGLATGPVPGWVQAAGDPPPADGAGGIAYRLAEVQLSLLDAVPREYHAFSFDVVHRDGLETAGHWSVQFQPEFQQVHLHHITITRDGVARQRLAQARIELLRRESRAADGIYDGWRTAEILIPDVQVGDRIDLAYTISGGNPVFGRLVHRRYTAAYSQPAGLRRVRVLAPAGQPLHWRKTGPVDYASRDRVRDGVRELLLVADPLPGVQSEDGSPYWFDGYGDIEVSNAAGWDEVARWSAGLFRSGQSRADLRRLAAELGLAGRGPEAALTTALEYVQREVRYVSLSIGESSHLPAPPSATLERRYGDCKDKSLLLAGLLAEAGLRAEPVLVNTGLGEQVGQGLAGPQAFDHAIVRAHIDGRWVYVDPTRNPESGPLDRRAPLGFGKGLPVGTGPAGLVDLEEATPGKPEVEVRMQWRLDNAGAKAPRLLAQVVTDYRYGEANRLRARFREEGAEKIGRGYLDYMRGHYADIDEASPPTLEDAPERNELTVTENYTLPLVPDEEAPGALGSVNLTLFQIEDWLPGFRASTRRWPLALQGPREGRMAIRVPMDGGWDVEAEDVEVANAHFRFRRTVEVEGDTLVVTGHWHRLGDHVPAQDYPAAREDLRRVARLMDYGVILGGGAAQGREVSARDLAWPASALLAAVLLLTGAWLARGSHALAGMFFRPRAAVSPQLQAPAYVQAAMLTLACALPTAALGLVPELVAGRTPEWGMQLLFWLLHLPHALLYLLLAALALRVFGVRARIGRLFIANAWGSLPYALLLSLALLACWPVLGLLAEPPLMPSGELALRLLVGGGGLLLAVLALGWWFYAWVSAVSEASGAGVAVVVLSQVLLVGLVFLLVFAVIIALLAAGIPVQDYL